ncbi:MAG: hypothetical protein CTY34_07730 [Methylobacter sp.]|nr:MAG: hypothetical protein CTY34_07730 [Methylobacter sp.]
MAKTDSLWLQLTAPENLWLAYIKARKGKSHRPDVAQFSMQVEMELFDLREALLSGDYRPADSYGLRKALFSEIVISKGMTEQAVGSRRFVEQQTGELAFRQPEQEHGK